VGYQGLGQLQLWLPNFLPKSNEKNLVTVKEMQLLTLKQGKNVQLGVFMVPLPLPWKKKKKTRANSCRTPAEKWWKLQPALTETKTLLT